MHFMTQFSGGQAELGRELLAGAAGPLDYSSTLLHCTGGSQGDTWPHCGTLKGDVEMTTNPLFIVAMVG